MTIESLEDCNLTLAGHCIGSVCIKALMAPCT